MICKHPLNMRQAVAGGVDSFDFCPYGVVCLRCGEIIFSGVFNKKKNIAPKLLFTKMEIQKKVKQ